MRHFNLTDNEVAGWENEDKADQAGLTVYEAFGKGKFLKADLQSAPGVVHVKDGIALTPEGAKLLERASQ